MSSHLQDSPSAPQWQEALRYWREQLAGAPPLLSLPADRPRSAILHDLVAREALAVRPDLGDALRDLARTEGATLFMALLSTYAILLGRYSGQADIVVGAPFAANILPVRLSLSGRASFRELLRRTREVVLETY